MGLDLVTYMKSFVAVANHASFAAAARQLQISTPVITIQIQRLEKHLGKPLFNRTTRKVQLTDAGALYLQSVKKILSDMTAAKDAVLHLEQEPHGLLTLGISGIFDSQLFTKFIQDFLNQFSRITLNIQESNSLLDLSQGSADIVIGPVDNKDKQFNHEYLLSVARGVFAAPSYIARYGTPKKIADLAKHHCLLYTHTSLKGEWILGKNKKVLVNSNYISSSGINVLLAAVAGIGLVWCPALTIQEELKTGQLVEVKLIDTPPIPNKYYLSYTPVNHGNKIKICVDFILAWCRDYFNKLP